MSRRTASYWVWAIVALALGTAWWIGHTQDDAFITFRYSQHLVEGHGPVWNPGEAVEGYSNFLWMLIMAVPIGLGFDPVTPSWLLGLLCLAGNLALSFRMFRHYLPDLQNAVLLLLVLASNFTLLAFGTSGLETSLNGLIWTAGIWMTLRLLEDDPIRIPLRSWVLCGLFYALAMLSRPDGFMLGAIGTTFILLDLLLTKSLLIKTITPLILSFTLPVLAWMTWKWNFYGELLPNTFYAKGNALHVYSGLRYLAWFGLSYLIFVPVVVLLWKWRAVRKATKLRSIYGGTLVAAWMVYLLTVGGDFMEFRMLVPVMPLLYLGIGALLFGVVTDRRLRIGVLGGLLLANLLHGPAFGRWFYTQPVFPVVPARMARPAAFMPYAEQGRALRARFGEVPDLHLAIGGAGAFPYYSGYRFTDIFGLTDPVTAQEGIFVGWGPGHNRLASLSHLDAVGVHLLVLRCDPQPGLPSRTEIIGTDPTLAAMLQAEPEAWPPEQLRLVRIHLQDDFYLTCVYLTPHPQIELFLQSNEIQEIAFPH